MSRLLAGPSAARGRTWAWAAVLLLVASAGAFPDLVGASANEGADRPTFEVIDPATEPFLSNYRGAVAPLRLHAQFGVDDAYLSISPQSLEGSYSPRYDVETGARVAFSVWETILLANDADARRYQTVPGRAGWSTVFADAPTLAAWDLSLGPGDHHRLAAPQLFLTTTLVALQPDGTERDLATDQRRVDLVPSLDARPQRVVVPLDTAGLVLAAGEGLEMRVGWHWVEWFGDTSVRPPLVTIHPSSTVDLPLAEPLRVLAMDSRQILDRFYVRAHVAHLFGVANLDDRAVRLFVHGPGGAMVSGSPLRWVPDSAPLRAHGALFDWELPLDARGMVPGSYHVYVLAGQLGDEVPRLTVRQAMKVVGPDDAIGTQSAWDAARADGAAHVMLGAALLAGAAAVVSRLAFGRFHPRANL